jgi:hypothetical protein
MRILLLLTLLWWGSTAYGEDQKQMTRLGSGSGKSFSYIAKKFGIPILKASIKIANGSSEQGRPLYHIQAHVHSLQFLNLLFRMNNRFISIVEAETFLPVQYVKEIDQEGFLTKRKNYLQTLLFDTRNRKVIVEKKGEGERREILLPSETHDPLSMFARCYLGESLHPGQDIRMSIYDGVKLREMVFHSKKERVRSKQYGEVEVVCMESSTSFSTFGEKEGIIRIWYMTDGKKTPISIELDLPIGNVKFELEDVVES